MSSTNIKPDNLYYSEETYSKGLSREDTLEFQIRIIVKYYSSGMWNEFEYSLKALYPLLPSLIRERVKPLKHNITPVGVEEHYQWFLNIQEMLENDTNMIWKKKFIKTYE